MKGMQRISRGAGFRGALNYAQDRDSPEAERGVLIGGNMSGQDAKSLAGEFGLSRQLRPDIARPVWHNALRLPAGERIDPDRFTQIADDYMERMGFSDQHQRCYWLHDDAEGQHIHIVASRVGLDGSVYLGRNENLKSTRHIAKLEIDYDLTITPGVQLDGDGRVVMPDQAKPTKGEIEMAVRTGEEPPKQKLQRLIDEAKADQPSAIQFAERLEAAGVTAVANLASTGKLNGFSFEVDGIAFKGSQLGKSYAWGALSKEVMYEQARDREALERFSAAARKRAHDARVAADAGEAGPGTGRADTIEHQSTDREISVDSRSADGGEVGQPGGAAGADTIEHQPTDREISVDGRSADGGEVGQPSGAAGAPGPVAGDTGRPEQGRDSASAAVGDKGRKDARRDNKEDDRNGESLDRRIPAVAEISPGAGQGQTPVALDSRFHFRPGDLGSYQRVLDLAGSTVSAGHKAKLDAWQQQHRTLQAPAYRLTLTARRDDLKTYNLGKGRGDNGQERTYTAQEIAGMIPNLSRQNARGYDVYVTPIDADHHYMVIDDMTPATVDRLKRSGYAPCLVQTSSQGNCQAIIKAPKESEGGKAEQTHANTLVQYLNAELGDPKFTGVIHPFRMAGFSNKKPGRGDFFTRIIEGGHRICGRAAQALEEMREAVRKRLQAAQEAKKQLEAHKDRAAEKTRLDALWRDSGGNHQDKLCKESYQAVLRQVEGAGWPLDMSKVDYRVAKVLHQRGLSDQMIERLLMEHSPSLHDRHSNPQDYARRTTQNALRELSLEVERQAQRSPSSCENENSRGSMLRQRGG